MIDVDERTELVNIFVSVAVESVEGVEIERSGRSLARQRSRFVRKVVVTIDQDSGGLIGDDRCEFRCGHVWKRKVPGILSREAWRIWSHFWHRR